jgi:hypothetical protein
MPPWRHVRGPATEDAGGVDDVEDPGVGSSVDVTAGEPESGTKTGAATGGVVPTARDARAEVDHPPHGTWRLEPVA